MHGNDCPPNCQDSHDANDSSSKDYWGGPDPATMKVYEKESCGCFVATAVYGGVDAPEVRRLRHWGETSLRVNPVGKYAVAFYEFVSPPFAEWLKTQPRTSAFVRSLLDKVVERIPELPHK